MSRLAAPCRRNGFVILQAVHSLPVALHPASLRRSYLQLHVLRLHIGRTFTLLTRQHHRRTHPREREDPEGHAIRRIWLAPPARRVARPAAARRGPLDPRFREDDKIGVAGVRPCPKVTHIRPSNRNGGGVGWRIDKQRKAAPWLVRHLNRTRPSSSKHSTRFSTS